MTETPAALANIRWDFMWRVDNLNVWMVCSRLQIRSGGLVTRILSFETEAAAILLVRWGFLVNVFALSLWWENAKMLSTKNSEVLLYLYLYYASWSYLSRYEIHHSATSILSVRIIFGARARETNAKPEWLKVKHLGPGTYGYINMNRVCLDCLLLLELTNFLHPVLIVFPKEWFVLILSRCECQCMINQQLNLRYLHRHRHSHTIILIVIHYSLHWVYITTNS